MGVPGANMYISTAAGTATATAIAIGRATARATERAAAGNNSNAATANRIIEGHGDRKHRREAHREKIAQLSKAEAL